jgi:hypothetical protein
MGEAVKKQDEGSRAFGVMLNTLGEGAVQAEATEQLHDLVKHLLLDANHGGSGKGKLTITLNLKAEREGTVAITSSVDVKAPKLALPKSTYWTTAQGNLTEHNPKQVKLPLREVPQPAQAADPSGAPAVKGV